MSPIIKYRQLKQFIHALSVSSLAFSEEVFLKSAIGQCLFK